MKKMMNAAKNRLETIKTETKTAVDSGKFAAIPADAEGITPQERLTWVAPSIDYINGVAAGLPQVDIEDALGKLKVSDEDELMLAYVGVIEAISTDQYVTEGKYNLKMALDILEADDDETDGDDEADETEGESAWEKIKGFFGKPVRSTMKDKKKKAAKPEASDSEDNEAALREAKIQLAKADADKADAEARADAAEKELKALKAKLKAMGIDT